MNILEIKNISVEINGKRILEDINLSVHKGETVLFFGPNGSGKTTLLMTIAGIPEYEVVDGEIILNSKNITSMDVDKRVKLGLGIGFQAPPEIVGVKLGDMIKICSGKRPDDELSEDELRLIEKFELKGFINRDINLGFSGGEKKRAEILQLLAMKPKILLLDEPDSGVDVESLRLIGKEIQKYLDENDASALIITHHGDILEYVNAEYAYVVVDGKIWCRGDPERIHKNILKKGYRGCVKCQLRHQMEEC